MSLGDTLRGTKGIMLDMYRQPDKLLKAMEALDADHDWNGRGRGPTDRESFNLHASP